jgi:hypothetical protein
MENLNEVHEILETQFNGSPTAMFQAVLDEHVHRGTEVEKFYDALEKRRPLTAAENNEAFTKLRNIRSHVVRAGEALRAAGQFEAITSSKGMSVN